MKTYSENIAQISTALADPTRREIMELVLYAGSPLSVREVADHFGLHANAARMHLDKLVKGGLLKVMRRRGERGGRPANLYDTSGEDWELNLPPRRYKLLAAVLAGGLAGSHQELDRRLGDEAHARGRAEAMASSSPLAQVPHGAGLKEIATAWLQEIEKRGHKADMAMLDESRIETAFSTCPFGEFSRDYPTLVCEIHRRLEEGVLSLAGNCRLKKTAEKCRFILECGEGHAR